MVIIPCANIRNFSIIAHIDHGKSTLADRLIQKCNGLTDRELKDRILDSMDIERERGITIKAQTVRLDYNAKDGITYQLNLIDTPGHVDFSYEVNRSLVASEGSLLVVDASQGVEAQTLANVHQALDNNHTIIPVLNKIDLSSADPDKVKIQIEEIIGLDSSEVVAVSSKMGWGIQDVLETLVHKLPSPMGNLNGTLKGLLIDSWYDIYLGVVILVRIINGQLRNGQKIRMCMAGAVYQVNLVGIFTPKRKITNILNTGEIGFITANIKHIADCRIGDTIVLDSQKGEIDLLPGFKPSIPVVFFGLFPVEGGAFKALSNGLSKLQLNDSSFHYERETSIALGNGFRCGVLGLLHLEIMRERLEREFNLSLVLTAPSVKYRLIMTNGKALTLYNPINMPDIINIRFIEEPWVRATIIVESKYLGSVLSLCTLRRGKQLKLVYIGTRTVVVFRLPLNEIIFDFYDHLKSISSGYASFNYCMDSYIKGDLVYVKILVNAEPVDALSIIVHRSKAESRGRFLCKRLKDLIPKHLFKIPIQASIDGKIIVRETISPIRKDVTAKCYGGDISRKRKLLSKQKKGKKKAQRFGEVEIPHNAFVETLKIMYN